MAKAYSTINTILKFGTSANSLTKLVTIKAYPDLGGAPEQLETTDLENDTQTFVEGIQSLSTMEFTCNYQPEEFDSADESAGTNGYYELDFGTNGADGKFTWQGTHSIRVSGGDVNAVREMVLTCTPSTKIQKEASA